MTHNQSPHFPKYSCMCLVMTPTTHLLSIPLSRRTRPRVDPNELIDLTEDKYEETNTKRVRFDLEVTPTPPPSPVPLKPFYLVVLHPITTSYVVLEKDWPGIVRDSHIELWQHNQAGRPSCEYFARHSGYQYLGAKHLRMSDIQPDLATQEE